MTRSSTCTLLAAGLAVGISIILMRSPSAAQGPAGTTTAKAGDSTNELAALRAEVTRLKGIVPDQSHAMKDVAYHFANLWFAGQKANWPLADFYWSETRSHLRWAVRIIPVRKDPQGNEIRLTEILDPIERSALQPIGDAIKAGDKTKFNETYRQMLDSCYACHLASGKPYLKLQVPAQPETPLIKFDPEP